MGTPFLEEFLGQLVAEFFDVIGLVAVGDEEGVFSLDDDEVIDSEEGDTDVLAVVEDDVVLGFNLGDFVVGLVAVTLGREILRDGDPGADVIPVEGGLDVEDAGGILHEGVVDGDGGEGGEFFGDGGGDVGGLLEFVDEAGELGGVLLELGGDGFEGPDEHAGVPGEVALAEEFFGELRVGLFAEAGDFEGLVLCLEAEFGRGAALDVSIGGAGPGGLDADGDEGIGFRGNVETVAEDGLEGVDIVDELVGGEDGHGGVGIPGGDEADAEGDGGCGVAFGRLGEDVPGGEHMGNFADLFLLEGVGKDQDVFDRDESLKSGNGLVEQRGVIEEIQKLLRFGISAERPEAGSAASSENQGVVFAHPGDSIRREGECQNVSEFLFDLGRPALCGKFPS